MYWFVADSRSLSSLCFPSSSAMEFTIVYCLLSVCSVQKSYPAPAMCHAMHACMDGIIHACCCLSSIEQVRLRQTSSVRDRHPYTVYPYRPAEQSDTVGSLCEHAAHRHIMEHGTCCSFPFRKRVYLLNWSRQRDAGSLIHGRQYEGIEMFRREEIFQTNMRK